MASSKLKPAKLNPPRFVVREVLQSPVGRKIRERWTVVDTVDPKAPRIVDECVTKRGATITARSMNELTGYVWRGYVMLDGRTTLQLEVERNFRKDRCWNFFLIRTSSGSRDGFKFADDALAYGSRLNPKIEWKLEGLTSAELDERNAR